MPRWAESLISAVPLVAARDMAHELLQPYMSLDSKLAPIFRDPKVMVDVQLIDAVLDELPAARLPSELRFAHNHYYQRAPHAGYGAALGTCEHLAHAKR